MRIPWNKGLKLGPNPEHSKRMKGRKLTEEHKQKISQTMKGRIPKNLSSINANKNGSNNPAWKGGITTEHYRLRRSNRFKNWRIRVFERDDYVCQICKERGNKIIPHHLNNFSEFKAERFIISNGITLCVKCHIEFHKHYGYRKNTKEQYNRFKQRKELDITRSQRPLNIILNSDKWQVSTQLAS